MTQVFFREPLQAAATFWRIYRRDGVVVGLTGHDRDLWFEGIVHRASPGMLPSSIQRSADLAPDSAEVAGALTDDSISAADLGAGRFDGARIEIGVVDWETLDNAVLYRGELGEVSEEAGRFEAELRSAKIALEQECVPRTSPTCRALFCGPGCTLSAARFTHGMTLAESDPAVGRVRFAALIAPERFEHGTLRWFDGPHAGLRMRIVAVDGAWLTVAEAIDGAIPPGAQVELREGCDHTIATCAGRFANAVNFQGEPFLPGNDFIARYPTASAP